MSRKDFCEFLRLFVAKKNLLPSVPRIAIRRDLLRSALAQVIEHGL